MSSQGGERLLGPPTISLTSAAPLVQLHRADRPAAPEIRPVRTLTALLLAGAIPAAGLRAADKDLVPSNLPADQKANLLRFLQAHEKARPVYPGRGTGRPPAGRPG